VQHRRLDSKAALAPPRDWFESSLPRQAVDVWRTCHGRLVDVSSRLQPACCSAPESKAGRVLTPPLATASNCARFLLTYSLPGA